MEQDAAVVFGARELDRVVPNPVGLIAKYRKDTGYPYYTYRPLTDANQIVLEDLAVTLLMNSQAGWRAAQGILQHTAKVDLSPIPHISLEQATERQRAELAEFIARVANWPGFGVSTATKLLHKKRPALIPILDNQAIFGAYMAASWPAQKARADTIKDMDSVRRALDWVRVDLVRSENGPAWQVLQELEPWSTKIELFDMVWWQHFREVQPVK